MQETDPRSEAAANEAAQRSKRLFGNQPDGSDGVAKVLREAREKKHEEIAKISSRLRIRAIYLQAIEEGRYRDLPGDAYAVGFVRAYATYLGLDGDETVRRFKEEASVSGKPARLIFPIPAREGRAPKAVVLLLSVLLALVVYGVWYAISDPAPSEPESKVFVEETRPDTLETELEASVVSEETAAAEGTAAIVEAAPEALPPSVSEAAPAPEAVVNEVPSSVREEEASTSIASEAAVMIVLRARRDTWIEIRDVDGRSVMAGVLYTNQIYRPPLQEGLTLAVGDAHGIDILVGGEAVPHLGASGVILRKVLLDPARLKAGSAVLD